MMRFARVLGRLAALLFISGMILHVAIPHHPHIVAGEVSTCCESHEHSDAQNHDILPCSIFSTIQLENFNPQIQAHFQEVNKHHSNYFNHIFDNCRSQHIELAYANTSIYIPEAVFLEAVFSNAFSRRGPPLA